MYRPKERTAMTTYTADTEQLVHSYVAVWSEPDAESRRSAIAGLWTRDGVEFVEGTRFRGQDELNTRVTEAYRRFVESGDYTVASANDVTSHHDIVMFTIQLIANRGGAAGEVAWAARVFLVLGADGRIREDYHLTVKPLGDG
jgi:hypothetical protein